MQNPTVWAFNWTAEQEKQNLLHRSVKSGKSRFGWSWRDCHDLNFADRLGDESFRNQFDDVHDEIYRQLFLLKVKVGDWIVHIHTPVWGKCVAAQVTSEYGFDEGIEIPSYEKAEPTKIDFRHNFSVDKSTIAEFDRNDPCVLPTVNLQPRQRYHRVYAVEDFLQSMENLKTGKGKMLKEGETREEYHLKDAVDRHLKEIASLIQQMHRGKKLEGFLAKVIRHAGAEVDETGSKYGGDHGADLVVTLGSKLGKIVYEHKIIVQVKSYEGDHLDLHAIEQIKTGMKHYDGTAGLLITTAERTEQLEKEAKDVAKDVGKPIDLLCGIEVAHFVLQNAPNMLFKS